MYTTQVKGREGRGRKKEGGERRKEREREERKEEEREDFILKTLKKGLYYVIST